MKINETAERYLTAGLKNEILSHDLKGLNEIRIRADKPVILKYAEKEIILKTVLNKADLEKTVSKMSEYSPYAFREEIRRGFITLKGGFRVGICGRAVIEKGEIKTIRDYSSLNIRVPCDVRGCSERLMNIYENGFKNTVIVSPPGCGKTTLLRDTVRCLSGGGFTVGVCDERGELNCFGDLGIRTDVLEGFPKAEGIETLVRGLAPDIIAVDELGGETDRQAVINASYTGVGIISTLHGESSDLKGFGELFKCIVVLENIKGKGLIKDIYIQHI
ncbi:MAG: stage III sporulation protein AA [Clostridiales bacterium]|nr:stage III sporulation protein AA [Clostridiales bacterium]